MPSEMKCPKCGSPMTTGFVLDMHQGAKAAEWIEGEPEKSVWTGLKLKDRRRFPLTADRCERCGFLEFYA
ncbi:MAG TPA: PF20097 family protein [Longimicrobium sp.]|nr:PF20097 family protein [Longimicrobium sp.]